MPVLKSTLDTTDETYRDNRRVQLETLAALEQQLDLVRAGGGERYARRHHERGRLLVRERLELLLDRDTPFLELSSLAAWGSQFTVGAIDGIGSTEMLHIFIAAADGDIRPGSTGTAVPGYRATILDESGEEVPDGVPGRLAVQGPTGCRYLSDERQRTYVQHGWNITGDTYIRDADGYFWYQARSDDMIISAGYNIAGPEVEEALLGHPDVLEVAVIGAPDPGRGMVVQAYVVLREGAAADPAKAAELQDFTKASIAPYKYPRVIEFVSELPKTISGKTQRYRLRQMAGAKLQARSG